MPTTPRQTGPSATSSSARLVGIPAESLDLFWAECAPLIQKGLDYAGGRYSLADVRHYLNERQMHLWIAVEGNTIQAVCITQIILYPQKKVCLIFLAAGKDKDQWLHLLNDIERCMLDNGCSMIELYGRPGWQKVLTGYQVDKVVLTKELL